MCVSTPFAAGTSVTVMECNVRIDGVHVRWLYRLLGGGIMTSGSSPGGADRLAAHAEAHPARDAAMPREPAWRMARTVTSVALVRLGVDYIYRTRAVLGGCDSDLGSGGG